MRRAAAIVAVACAACGGGTTAGWGLRPIGWRGSIPSCATPHVVRGTAYRDADPGRIAAVAPGRAEVQCGAGEVVAIEAGAVARVVLEPLDARTFRVHAFDGAGRELSLQDMADDVVQWRADRAEVRLPYPCNDAGFGLGCARRDDERVVDGPGPTIVYATVGGVTGTHVVPR